MWRRVVGGLLGIVGGLCVGLICFPIVLVLVPGVFAVGGVRAIIYRALRPGKLKRLRAELAARGRCLAWEAMEAELSHAVALGNVAGTVLSNSPSPGCPELEVWWVRGESVRECAAREGIEVPVDFSALAATGKGGVAVWIERAADPQFDRWCGARYFDPVGGKALLVESTFTNAGMRRLLARMQAIPEKFPGVETIEVMASLSDAADAAKA